MKNGLIKIVLNRSSNSRIGKYLHDRLEPATKLPAKAKKSTTKKVLSIFFQEFDFFLHFSLALCVSVYIWSTSPTIFHLDIPLVYVCIYQQIRSHIIDFRYCIHSIKNQVNKRGI